ncbi:MAG: tetratricopeptide repeat protein [Endomicrobium sp.]|jgi:tetratricopeptide (TPR) repeat protein|nr:tetratricopeptide repeat protein [Endomicrobium sp.]
MKINKLFFILLSSLFLGGPLFAANYEAYKTFLKETFDLKIGHIDDCIKNYEKVTDLDKEAFSVYKNLAYVYWQAGKIDKAFEIAQKIDEIDGSNPKTTGFLATFYLVKARIHEKIGQLDSAIKEYENYASVFPDNALVLMYLGKCFYEAQNYQKAKDYLLKAKKRLPNNPTINFWLGIIYEKNGQFDKAAAELENVEKAEEKNISIITKLGYFYSILKNYQKAEKEFLKAIGIAPQNHEIFYLAALNYMDWKRYDKAIKYFKKVIIIEPKFSDAYFYLGLAYDKEKDFTNAEQTLLRAIEINPEHAKAMNYLGYAYADKGIKLKESEIFLIRAVTLEPKNSARLDSLGWLYYRLGNFKLAEKFLLAAIKITKDPLMYDHLGDTYAALNKPVQAWIAYSLSFDFKEDKKIRKKLDSVQKQTPLGELYKQMLLRSESNYFKLFPFKTGFKTKISSNFLRKKFYIPFSYHKNNSVKIDLPAILIPGGMSAHIKNGTYEFVPKAIENQLPKEISNIISKTCEFLSDNFYKQFGDAKITQKGNRIIYSKKDKELILNLDTALIESFFDKDLTVTILKYEKFVISNVPKKIKFAFKNIKIKGLLETTKISPIPGDNQNENNSQSSGKN